MARCVRKRRSVSFWSALVAEQAATGTPVAMLCRRENIYPSQFYRWRKALADREVARGTGASATLSDEESLGRVHAREPERGSTDAESAVTPGFVELRLAADAPFARDTGVEIVVARGARIRLGAGFDAETLARALAVLRDGARP